MFVNVFTYRAKEGRVADVIAHLEEWDRSRRPKVEGFVSAEVYQDVRDERSFINIARFESEPPPAPRPRPHAHRSFINIARFESEPAARAVADHPEQDAWYRRLVDLCDAEPLFTDCHLAWQTH